ncbi:hypothetical protein EDB85DRAFT_1889857 [Lactarius pseudohatsudake]|nr:hypothetical protein EDB85DRAFT_1889857 [Lactarius pseudohatsudake]
MTVAAMIGKLYRDVLSLFYMVNAKQPLQPDERPTTFMSTLTVPAEGMYTVTRSARGGDVAFSENPAECSRVKSLPLHRCPRLILSACPPAHILPLRASCSQAKDRPLGVLHTRSIHLAHLDSSDHEELSDDFPKNKIAMDEGVGVFFQARMPAAITTLSIADVGASSTLPILRPTTTTTTRS